jgi:hypothetical protein
MPVGTEAARNFAPTMVPENITANVPKMKFSPPMPKLVFATGVTSQMKKAGVQVRFFFFQGKKEGEGRKGN